MGIPDGDLPGYWLPGMSKYIFMYCKVRGAALEIGGTVQQLHTLAMMHFFIERTGAFKKGFQSRSRPLFRRFVVSKARLLAVYGEPVALMTIRSLILFLGSSTIVACTSKPCRAVTYTLR